MELHTRTLKILTIVFFLPVLLAFDYSNGPTLDVRINQTSSGKFIIHFPGETAEKNNLMNFTSLWMQDDLNKQLYVSTGEQDYGDSMCFAKYWFKGRMSYELSYLNSKCDGPVVCSCVDGFGYDEEIDHYNLTYMAWVDTFISEKFGNKRVAFFTGRMEDGVGRMTNSAFIDLDQGSYLGMVVHETQEVTDGRKNVAYFREYIYDNITMTQPDASFFALPQECVAAEKAGCKKVGSGIYRRLDRQALKFLQL